MSPAAFWISREDGLQPLLELAAILRAREQRADVERPHPLALQPFGDVARHDPLSETLDDCGLAHTGLADQHRVVLRTSRENLDHAAHLLVAADDRVELARLGERGQVAPVLLERLVGALGILRGDVLPASHVLQRLEQRFPRHDVERQQEVLDGGVLVPEAAHLLERLVEYPSEGRRGLRLRRFARDRGLVSQPRLGLGAQLRGAVAASVDERPRQFLLEESDREVVGRELGIAAATRELLRSCDGLLGLERQLLKVHYRLLAGVSAGR